MPQVEVRFFEDERGRAPVERWIDELRREDRLAYARCHAAIQRLAEFGHELRRPHADYLDRGIHELRIRSGRKQLRLLYFFHGRNAVVLIHALSKEGRIQEIDLARAVARRRDYEADPDARTHERHWRDD